MLNQRRSFLCCTASLGFSFIGKISAKSQTAETLFVCGYNASSTSTSLVFAPDPHQNDLIRALHDVSFVMQIHPQVKYVDDGSGQIMQTAFKPNVSVVIGKNMLSKLEAMGGQKHEIMVGMVAHEFAHVLQTQWPAFISVRQYDLLKKYSVRFTNEEELGRMSPIHRMEWNKIIENNPSDGPFLTNFLIADNNVFPIELHADFIAGWVLGKLRLLTVKTYDGFLRDIYGRGDYFYTSALHHGEPEQRISAAGAGYLFANDSEFFINNTIETLMGDRKISNRSVRSVFEAGQAYVAGMIR